MANHVRVASRSDSTSRVEGGGCRFSAEVGSPSVRSGPMCGVSVPASDRADSTNRTVETRRGSSTHRAVGNAEFERGWRPVGVRDLGAVSGSLHRKRDSRRSWCSSHSTGMMPMRACSHSWTSGVLLHGHQCPRKAMSGWSQPSCRWWCSSSRRCCPSHTTHHPGEASSPPTSCLSITLRGHQCQCFGPLARSVSPLISGLGEADAASSAFSTPTTARSLSTATRRRARRYRPEARRCQGSHRHPRRGGREHPPGRSVVMVTRSPSPSHFVDLAPRVKNS